MTLYTLDQLPALLRDVRAMAGLTQPQLADRMGISQQFVSFRECGKRQVPLATLMKIAAACGTELVLVTRPVTLPKGSTDV
jgi:transcriptional regulator with XRE-family HTH domain